MATNNLIDTVRTYWDSRPCNIRHSTKEVGTREYFDEVEARKYYVEPHISEFAEFDKWVGKRVLEIGCGIGTDTINFARAGAKVTAVDMSRVSLDIAKKRAQLYGLPVEFYWANVEKLSETVPVGSYDLVYSFGVLHHTPHPEKALEEIKKYVTPGGTLKIMVYHRLSWKVFWIWLKYGRLCGWAKLGELVARYSEAQTGCPVTYTYTKKSVRGLLKDFNIKNIKIDHIFPYQIEKYKKHIYKRVWYFRVIPKKLFHLMERSWGWHLCVTAERGVIRCRVK